MNYNRLLLLFVATFLMFNTQMFCQDNILNTGLKVQKSFGLYFENGIDIEYSNNKVLNDQVYLGFSYISSRLGTAFKSNAIKQDNYILSLRYYSRLNKKFRPFSKLNFGYFKADYVSDIFNMLDNKSLLIGMEMGMKYQLSNKLNLFSSLGYNFISGNGMTGPGTLYPIFFQNTVSWNIFNK